MWLFWIVAGALAAGAAVLALARSQRASRAAQTEIEDPALSIYRRQLAELEEQTERGVLGSQEHRAARAEAARRLLGAADARRAREGGAGLGSRAIVVGAVAVAGLGSLGLYGWIGSPGTPDQPYRARVQAWRRVDPSTLDPPRMAAVLRAVAAERPRDVQAWDYLGRAELAAGDAFSAARAFERAIRLAPDRADLQVLEGEALIGDSDGQISAPARAAFARAQTLDPANQPARYFLGRAAIADGRTAAGLAIWRGLVADLPRADPRREALLNDMAQLSAGPASARGAAQTPSTPPAESPSMTPQQLAFVQAMVARQALALQSRPDDAQGWARLIRSYGVLNDRAAQDQALATARRLFRGRPELLATIEAQARFPTKAAPAGLSP